MFNPELLLSSNYVQPTKINRINNPLDESYFSIAVKAIEEMSNIGYDNEKALYRSVLEAGESQYMINESFLEFKESAKKIIDKFIALIKSLFARFVTAMNSIIQSDKYLKKHKTDIMNFSAEDEFKMSVYKYTNIVDSQYPRTEAYIELAKEFNMPALTVEGGKNITKELLTNHIRTFYTGKKDGMKSFYEGFRAKVLGRDGNSYDAGEYAEELFEFYRGGEKDKAEETIDREFVINAYQRFTEYDKTVKAIKDIQNNLEKEYNQIKKGIKDSQVDDGNMINVLYDKDRTDNYASLQAPYAEGKKEIDLQIDLIEKLRIQKIEEMCKIHSLSFAAKLDAVKECYKQDKKVLYKALNKVQKVHESGTVAPEVVEEASGLEVDSYSMNYTSLLVTEAANQQKLIRAITEADLLSRGMLPIQESAVDTIKAGIQKIIAAIKKVFAQFMGKVKEFVQTDKSWLSDNKTTILNEPWKEREIEGYKYNECEAKLTGDTFKIPDFNFDEFKAIATSENVADAFITKYFNTVLKTGEDIKEQIIDLLRGEQETLKISSFNKKDLYTFCVNYESITANLEKDLTKIENNQAAITKEITKLEDQITSAQKEAERAKEVADNNNSQIDNQANKAQADAQQAEKEKEKLEQEAKKPNPQSNPSQPDLSKVKESYVSLYDSLVSVQEDGLKIGKLENDQKNVGSASNAKSAKINTGASAISKDQTDTVASNATTADSAEGQLKELDNLKTGAPKYFECDSAIILAKFVVCQKMYKDYIALLHAHVESYAGTDTQKK